MVDARSFPAEQGVQASVAEPWAIDGQWLSKGEAATWACARLADPAPVAKALARRTDSGAPGPTSAEVATVLEPVARLLATGVPPPRPE